MKTILIALPFVALTSAALAADPAPAAKEMGDLWEVTSQMTMEGMPAGFSMPAQTRKVCADRDWKKPPVAQDERSKCEMLDFQNTPAKSTWKMRCAGPPAMTGEGEITRSSPEAYAGWMKMTSSEGTMTMKLSGRRVGECDAGEAKKEREEMVARAQAQAATAEKTMADAKEQACMAPVQSLDFHLLNMQAVTCEGPKYKAAFCEKAATCEGLKILAARETSDPENGLTAVAKACNLDIAELTKKCCDEAMKKQQPEDLDYIGKNCPAATAKLAEEHCAGRTYTSMAGDPFRGFCVTYAKATMDNSKAAPQQESTGQKMKKSLKSLIPH